MFVKHEYPRWQQSPNCFFLVVKERKGIDLTQSCDKSPYTDRKSKKQCDNTKTQTKNVITQRLQTDLGRSVGVTIATELVC